MPTKYFLNQAQLESLTSPTRLAIVQLLEADQQATARELAHRMGRRITSLYHHLKHLTDVGVLHVVGERKGERRPEAIYATVARYLSSLEVIKTRQGREIYCRAAGRVAEAGVRALSATVAHGNPIFEGKRRDAMVRFYTLRATNEKLARLNALLDELDDAAMQPSEDGEAIQLTVLMSRLA